MYVLCLHLVPCISTSTFVSSSPTAVELELHWHFQPKLHLSLRKKLLKTWKMQLVWKKAKFNEQCQAQIIKPGVYFDLGQKIFTPDENFYALLLHYFCRIKELVNTSLLQPFPGKAIIQNLKHLEQCLKQNIRLQWHCKFKMLALLHLCETFCSIESRGVDKGMQSQPQYARDWNNSNTDQPLWAQLLPQKELRMEKSCWWYSKFEEAHVMVKSSHSSTCLCLTPFLRVPEICKAPWRYRQKNHLGFFGSGFSGSRNTFLDLPWKDRTYKLSWLVLAIYRAVKMASFFCTLGTNKSIKS